MLLLFFFQKIISIFVKIKNKTMTITEIIDNALLGKKIRIIVGVMNVSNRIKRNSYFLDLNSFEDAKKSDSRMEFIGEEIITINDIEYNSDQYDGDSITIIDSNKNIWLDISVLDNLNILGNE
jgi:hypothetical protein